MNKRLIPILATAALTLLPAAAQHNYVQPEGVLGVTVDTPFSPYGNRTEYEKFCDDGSALLLDVNGVLLWRAPLPSSTSDQLAGITVIPNSSQATPLYVTKTEAIVWNNALAPYADYTSKAAVQIIYYRRDPTSGAIISSTTLSGIQGKDVVQTPGTIVATNSFTILTTERIGKDWDGGNLLADPSADMGDGDDAGIVRAYRVTVGGGVQQLGVSDLAVLAGNSATGPKVIDQAYGSDGSVAFQVEEDVGANRATGGTADTLVGQIYWVDGARAGSPYTIQKIPVTAANSTSLSRRILYTSNTRLVYESPNPVAAGQVDEFKRNADTGAIVSTTPTVLARPAGVNLALEFSSYTNVGKPCYYWALGAANTVVCVRIGATLTLDFSATVTGASILGTRIAVFNPGTDDADGDEAAIAIQNNDTLWWLMNNGVAPATNSETWTTPLPTADQSNRALPLFVSETEATFWWNGRAPLVNGQLPPVEIRHYDHTGGALPVPSVMTNLTTSVQGTYVLGTSPISGDYPTWLFTTLEKTSTTSLTFRDYLFVTAADYDADGDGLSAAEEVLAGTDANNPDSDGDGLSDGREVKPYEVILGAYTWEQARADAVARGGHLAILAQAAVPNSKPQTDMYFRLNRQLTTGQYYWIGGQDKTAEAGSTAGNFRWINPTTSVWASTTATTKFSTFVYTNFATGYPNNFGNADAVKIGSDGKWYDEIETKRLAGYIIQYTASNPMNANDPNNNPALAYKDSDGDGLSDAQELLLGTSTTDVDSDADGITDGEEVNYYNTNPLVANPLPVMPAFDLTQANLQTSYQGTVFESDGRAFGVMTVSLGNKGSFSFSADSLFGKGSGRGTLTANGQYTGTINIFGRVAQLELYLLPATASSRPVINARFTDPNLGDVIYYARLQQPVFTNTYKTQSMASYVGNYTLASSQGTDGLEAGLGQLVGFVSVTSNGSVSGYGYVQDGSKFRVASGVRTSALPSVASVDNRIPILSRVGIRTGTVQVVGDSQLRVMTESDYDGKLRVHRWPTMANVAFAQGYDEERVFQGGLYYNTGLYQMPVKGIPVKIANARIDLSGGSYDIEGEYPYDLGTDIPFYVTWNPQGSILSPTSTQYKVTGSFNPSSGEIGMTAYTYYTPGIVQNTFPMRMAVLQKTNTVTGFYYGDLDGGLATMSYNVEGTLPPNILITPTSKNLNGDGGVYSINVKSTPASSIWPLTLDSGAAMSAYTADDGATYQAFGLLPQAQIDPSEVEPAWVQLTPPTVDSSGGMYGTGTGVLGVYVAPNTADTSRTLAFRVGGIKHSLWQAPRNMEIVPATKTVGAEGAIYPVDVRTVGAWDPTIDNNVDWVTILNTWNNDAGTGGFLVQVAANTTTLTRTAVIVIGAKTHIITQKPATVNLAKTLTTGGVTYDSKKPTVITSGAEGGSITYAVTTAVTNWTVDIPAAVTWVSYTLASGNTTGNGNDTLTITVSPYSAGLTDRTATITIGGKLYTINQSKKLSALYRP